MNAFPAIPSPVSPRSRHGLRFWMFLVFGCLVLFIIVSTSLVRSFGIPWLGISGTYQDMKIQTIDNFNLLADHKKAFLEFWLRERYGDLSLLADNTDARKKILKICQVFRAGEQTADIAAMPEFRDLEYRLKTRIRIYPSVEAIHIVDNASGVIVVSSDRRYLGRQTEGETEFKAFMDSRLDNAAWFVAGKERQTSHMNIASLVKKLGGGSAPFAALVSLVSIDEILLPLLHTGGGLGKSGEVVLVDHNQRILTPIKHPLPEGKAMRVGESRIETLPAALSSRGKEGVMLAEDYRGVSVLACFRHVNVGGGLGWGMVVKQDKSEIMGPIWRQLVESWLVGVAWLLIALVCCIILAQYLVAPVRILTQAASRMRAGDFSKRVSEATGYREVEELSSAFNSMAGRLSEWDAELSREIASKTQQLTDELGVRKRAEKDLKNEQKFIQSILDASPAFIVAYETAGKTLMMNQALLDVLEYTAGEAREVDYLTTFVPEEDREMLAGVFEQLITEGKETLNENRIISRSGRTYIVEWHGRPVTDEHGDISMLIGAGIDITARKQAEKEKASLEEQLWQAQKMESIGRLAGGIAHDFNNMLAIILGYGEILLHKLPPGDPLLGATKEIVEAGRRSAALTRQLLAFSRKLTLHPEVLEINAVVRNMENMLRRLIGENIEMKLSLAESLAHVMADPGQIEQVVMNLAVNARDAMPQGGTLIIETANVVLDNDYPQGHASVVPGRYVMLAMTDTGCGMDKETLSEIFEPFFTTKERGKGTGLGLATVYGIIKQSGGNIWAYSEPGQGSTFKVYMPQTQAETKTKEVMIEEDKEDTRGRHILVAEDEASLRGLLEIMLSNLGYQVTSAADGGEALLLVKEKRLKPDLVITDVVMPGMSGKDMVERLRKSLPEFKVLYISGYTDNAIVHHGVLDPDKPFLQKPFTKDALAAKVRELLSGKSARSKSQS